ncbi:MULTISPECIES: hypothetical protein [unclassified Bartonella]|uniref:hypothetical protein n=1 Tax=unclassified Bartonella TaxID=2645622 RepID=UPI0035D05DAC
MRARFINVETLQDLIYMTAMTETKILSSQEAADILVELREKALLTSAGKLTDTLKAQWATGTLDLSERFSKGQKQAVLQALEASQAMPIIRNATRARCGLSLKSKQWLHQSFWPCGKRSIKRPLIVQSLIAQSLLPKQWMQWKKWRQLRPHIWFIRQQR